MAKELQFRRGTTAQHATFAGAEGEITVDTDKDVVVVHDGTTAGGFPLARESEVVSSIESTPNTLVRRDPYNGIWAGTGTFSDLVIFSDPTTDLGGTLILTGHNDSHMMVSNDSGTLVIGDGAGDLLKVAGGTGVVSAKDIHAPHIHLTSTDGSAPFSVASSVKVTNLNADLLDGMYATTAVVPDTLVVRDGNACLSGKGLVVDNGLADGGNVQFLSAGNTSINIDNNAGVLRVFDSEELLKVTSNTGDIWAKGEANFNGGVYAPFVELGSADTTASTPYIDFHSGTTVTDYDSRIIASGGTSSAGDGSLSYVANGGHTFQGQVDTSHIVSTGSGNDFNTGGVELVGNGVTNTVFPTLGFHQSGLYAGSLQQRGALDFRLYNEGATAYANLTVGTLTGNATSATISTNIAGGSIGTIPYQTAANTTAQVAVGTVGQYLKSNGASAPVWDTIRMEDIPTSSYESSCRVATTADITLSGTQTIDGIAVVAGDRVLVKEQTLPQENGIYVVNASTWTRALDADTSAEISVGIVNVDSGTVNGGFTFKTRFRATDTLGTTAMNWFSFMSVDTAPIAGGFDTSATTPTAANRLNYNGYLYPTLLNLVGSGDTTTAATHYFVETDTDGFVRPKTLANAQAELVTFASVYDANKTWFTMGGGTAGINGATNYALFPAVQDTLTLEVGTYEIEIVAYVTVTNSTAGGALRLNLRGAGTAVGTFYGMSTGAITQNVTPVQTGIGSAPLGTALTVTPISSAADRNYNVQLKGIMNVTTAGTIIPSYQFSATLTSGGVIPSPLNYMKINQIASTSVITAGGWV